MIRGTTPTHIFKLSIDTSTLKEIRLTYKQYGEVVLEKTEKDVQLEDNMIRFTFNQEESMLFRAGMVKVEVQLKVLTTSDTVLASPIKYISVEEILNTEVLE